MITTTILVILGVALVVVLWKMFGGGAKSKELPASSRSAAPEISAADVDPATAQKGDVVSLRGAAEDFSDIDFPIDRRSAYEAGNRRWVDLSGEYRGQRVYLEVVSRDEALAIVDARKLTLADLNVTEAQLADMDARHDASQSVAFDGKRWRFESSRELGYFENEAGDGEGLYRWLFEEQGGKRLLCIEKWEGEPFEVRFARKVGREDITIYRSA